MLAVCSERGQVAWTHLLLPQQLPAVSACAEWCSGNYGAGEILQAQVTGAGLRALCCTALHCRPTVFLVPAPLCACTAELHCEVRGCFSGTERSISAFPGRAGIRDATSPCRCRQTSGVVVDANWCVLAYRF